jgi:hypothetical protein
MVNFLRECVAAHAWAEAFGVEVDLGIFTSDYKTAGIPPWKKAVDLVGSHIRNTEATAGFEYGTWGFHHAYSCAEYGEDSLVAKAYLPYIEEYGLAGTMPLEDVELREMFESLAAASDTCSNCEKPTPEKAAELLSVMWQGSTPEQAQA